MSRSVDLGGNGPHVPDGFYNIPGAGFTFCADHCGTFRDTAERFTEVTTAADEGDGEGVFFDVVGGVGGGEDFGFVDIVDSEGFEYLWRGES